MDKLYVVVRGDMSIGYQMVQSAHAVAKFTIENPEISREWHEVSQYMAVLSVPNETTLLKFMGKAMERGITVSAFVEPDLNDEVTAVAFAPGNHSRKLLANLRLAGGR